MPNPSAFEARAISSSMETLLMRIFERLEAEGLAWAVLRNPQGLPAYTRNDVDLLIKAPSLLPARRVIVESANAQGWRCLAFGDKYHYHPHWLMSGGDEPQFLPLELWTGLSWRGNDFADAGEGLEMRRLYAPGIWTVAEGFEAATTVMKELLPHGKLKESARDIACRAAKDDAETFQHSLERCLGGELAARVRDRCAAGDWDGLHSLTQSLRRAVRCAGLPGYLRRSAYGLANIRYHLSPPLGALVVVLGPDGSGKTTLNGALGRSLHKRPFQFVHHCKNNFGILPELKRFKVWLGRLAGREVTSAPPAPAGTRHIGMAQPHPFWRSLLYVIYYAIDLCLGRLRLRRWRAQGSLVLFDRYYFDYYYQVGNRNLPKWCLDLVGLLVPEPDLILYVDREADDIYQQKPELTVSEIRYQQELIKRLLANKPNARIVDAREGVEATCRVSRDHIISFLLSRAKVFASMS